MARIKRLGLMGVAAAAVVVVGATPALAASYAPASNPGRLCNYSTFEANGVDGKYHRYTYYTSSAIPGGGREAQWRVANFNNTGQWVNVGYTSRVC